MPNSVCRSLAVWSLSTAFLLPMVRTAGGQDIDWQSDLTLAQPGELSLAFQPGDIAEEAQPPSPSPSDLDQPGPLAIPEPADRLQPPPPSTLPPSTRIIRLAGMPNMYGDFFGSCGQLHAYGFLEGQYPEGEGEYGEYGYHVVADLPCPGGGRTAKISENDKAWPMDRVFFMYNHYANALEATASPTRPYSIDQYTVGIEKTFLDGRWSAEVRMPFNSPYRFTTDDFRVGTAKVGNLGVTLKRLLWVRETSAVAAGLGIDLPTGSDATGYAGLSSYTLHNDSAHLLPFIGFLRAPNDVVFYQGFLQLDVATNGNRVVFGDTELGELTQQNLLYVDFSVGRWLARNAQARHFKGLAALVEYHYTTTLQDADIVTGFVGPDFLAVGNTFNRIDVSNVTVGLHAEIGRTTIRVGGVFPLRDAPDRDFDAEFQIYVNRLL